MTLQLWGNHSRQFSKLKSDLSARYEMSDLREIESYLGVRITRDRKLRRLEIDQSGYLKGVLERFGMADANPHNTLLPAGAEEHLTKFDGQTSASDIKHYQSLIGSLMYLQIGTWLDISSFEPCHWEAIKAHCH
jgi:hypothetical protein